MTALVPCFPVRILFVVSVCYNCIRLHFSIIFVDNVSIIFVPRCNVRFKHVLKKKNDFTKLNLQ